MPTDCDSEPQIQIAGAPRCGTNEELWILFEWMGDAALEVRFQPLLQLGHGADRVVGDLVLHAAPDALDRLQLRVVRVGGTAG